MNHVKNLTLSALAVKLKNYFLGFFYSIRFDESKWVQAAGKIKIKKKYGYIKTGKCLFWPDVVINIKGRDRNNKGILEIGDFTTIGDRTEFHIAEKVTIGNNVIIAWDCVILDHAYHKIKGESEKIGPVVIEDNVWIACRSIILPGVKISSNSVIAAGSVVTRDVQPNTLVAGNPARVVREIEGWES